LIIRLVDTCNRTAHNRQRIIDVGAKLYEDHRTADGLGWVTLLDPEGNEFCIEQIRAGRHELNDADR
jgi:hypothetical protein